MARRVCTATAFLLLFYPPATFAAQIKFQLVSDDWMQPAKILFGSGSELLVDSNVDVLLTGVDSLPAVELEDNTRLNAGVFSTPEKPPYGYPASPSEVTLPGSIKLPGKPTLGPADLFIGSFKAGTTPTVTMIHEGPVAPFGYGVFTAQLAPGVLDSTLAHWLHVAPETTGGTLLVSFDFVEEPETEPVREGDIDAVDLILDVRPVPEPATIALVAIGCAAAAWRGRSLC